MTDTRPDSLCLTILLSVIVPLVGIAGSGCSDAQGVAASRAGGAPSLPATADQQVDSTTASATGEPASASLKPDVPSRNTSSESDAAAAEPGGSPDTTQVAMADTAKPKAAAKPRGVRSISFDDIKFEMEKDSTFKRTMLTDTIEGYDGTTIRIRGFILPSFKQNGLTEFVLVRDNMECCFGPGAALYDCIMVRMKPGKSTSFSVRPVSVEGSFSISEWKDFDGVVRAIYHLDGDEVK